MTAASDHKCILSCLASDSAHSYAFLAKEVKFGIHSLVYLQFDVISYARMCIWDCTGVFYEPYVQVSLTVVKNPPLRAERTDRTYGPYVRSVLTAHIDGYVLPFT